MATETAEQVHAARQQGYQDGYRDGLVALDSFKQSFAQQTSAQVGTLLQAMDTELQALEQQLARTVTRVATELARQVVRSELAIRPALVAQVAQDAVNAVLMSARHITVQLHPDDHALVAQGCAEALAARGARLVASPALERGGCRVDSDAGTIDARIVARWAQATQALGTGVSWSDAEAGPGGDA
ncbi:MAG: flagellar biosynthesis protein [Burkholderiales bacterium PBB5]|nr:MAG: flagellar biosynthesis protein [Burkholderiales bacterium PBB5]